MENLEREEQRSADISSEELPVPTSNNENQQEPESQAIQTEQIHQQTRSGDIVSPRGDNANINIYHFHGYYSFIKGIEKRAARRNDDEEATVDLSESTEDASITENLLFGQQNLSHIDEVPLKARSASKELPYEEEKLSDWYYELDEYEQCYIQAVAIFHGAAVGEFSPKVDTFYRLTQKQKHILVQPATPQQEASLELISKEHQTFTFPRKPRLRLQERTYTITRRVKGTECIFWQDVNALGQSLFESHVLSFLAKEFISKGEHWEHFLKTIEDWSSKRGETSWRAARALGVLLWYQDLSQFQRRAETWAKKGTKNGQALAASLLDAACEVELLPMPGHTQQIRNSPVLALLREWTKKVQNLPTMTNIHLGCTTAKAYGLIGKNISATDIVLQGVNDLLKFEQKQEITNIHLLLAAVVSTYVNLTWAGRLRTVLQHLAETAEELVHRQVLPEQLEDRSQYRAQREIRLRALFKAFFLVAAATSSQENPFSSSDYAHPLETEITIPDPYERDVFLAAIVIEDDIATAISTVLCSVIVTINHEQGESKIAFQLIRQWVDTILPSRKPFQPNQHSPYEIFIQFLVNLEKSIETWCNDLGERGYRIPGAHDVFKHKLVQWHDEGIALADDVLIQLPLHPVS